MDENIAESKEADCKCDKHVFSNEDTMRIHAIDFALKKKDTTIFSNKDEAPSAEDIVKDAKVFYEFLTKG